MNATIPDPQDIHTRFRVGFTLVFTAIGVIALALPAVVEAQATLAGPCTRTTDSMIRACRNEVRDDYWVAASKCHNLTSARAACRSDAEDERDDAADECVAQRDARAAVCADLGEGAFDPVIDPANFVSPAEAAADPNPWLPLIPGAEWVYESGSETITVTVTAETKEILGVTCTVVRDVVEDGGVPIEDTIDWYAQDEDGNVWYFGEISQNFEEGELVSLDGSWKGGVDGAKPGIAMKAAPQVGEVYRQEFFLGDAEDIAEVTSLTGNETSPAASCAGACLVTREYTPITPEALEIKYYVAGVGFVLEIDGETGERGAELVSVSIP